MRDTPPLATPVRFRPWLQALAALLVVGTFALIAIGGNVTSYDAGMAVPDWPGTFGYNMFLAPLDVWFRDPATGQFFHGAFWEHFHRLTGATVGVIAIALAVGLWLTQRRRPWLRWLGILLLGSIIVQGLLGGFRVAENSVILAGVHGVFGQIVLAAALLVAAATGRFWISAAEAQGFRGAEPQPFFRWEIAALVGLLLAALVGSIALSKSGYTESHREWSWVRVGGIWTVAMALFMAVAGARFAWGLGKVKRPGTRPCAGPERAAVALLVLLIVQLAVGAAVRHSGAEKAIPDAPLAFGSLLPPNTEAQLDAAIAALPPSIDPPPPDTTIGMIHLHFTHRVLAVVVLGVLAWLVVSLVRSRRLDRAVVPPLMTTVGLVAVQVMLGIMTVWTGIYPTIATAHQATGAALLAFVTWLAIRVHLTRPAPTVPVADDANRYNPDSPRKCPPEASPDSPPDASPEASPEALLDHSRNPSTPPLRSEPA